MTVLVKISMRMLPGVAVALSIGLVACSGSGDSTTVAGDVPVAYVKRVNTLTTNPLNAAPSAPGGDLMIRATSSPSAPEYNITAPYTQGVGDVSDPEVSYDGTKIVFAMNCPPSNTGQVAGGPACTGHWNIWEYDMTTGGITAGSFRRITSSTQFDDVGPAYLPSGNGFVFSSNRQAAELATQFVDASGTPHSYQALDEYERETVFNLHTMDSNGGSIQQISFNQSHDRNPVVRPDGTVMFARWEHVADRNRFTVFTVKPNGTTMFVLYGAHADGNSFLHPRDMDPNGPYAGYIVSDLMPLDRTQSGGALMLIDTKDYSDQNNPINSSVPTSGGQVQMTAQQLNTGTGLSQYGRVTTPYPLWDGTNRILVAYTPCEVTNAGVVVSCDTLSSAEIAALSDPNRLITQIAADPVQANVPPSYSIYMFDPSNQTWLLVAAPPAGYIYTDPIPLQARSEPVGLSPVNASTSGTATVAVQSVFDTDILGRMGQGMLAPADVPAGCTAATSTSTAAAAANAMIPQIAPLDPQDTRPTVANLVQLKDPAQSAYNCSPIRFVRVIRAIAPPSGSTGERQAIGDTNFEQNRILGYAPVEPDGSFQITIPADTPIAFSVVDAQGRAIQVHTNWIQARSGEIRTCDGCHSPRRGAAINSGSVADTVPAAWTTAMRTAHQTGDTMASTHVRVDATQLVLKPDMTYTDVWAANAGQARPAITIDYSLLTKPGEVAPIAGIIDYPTHIQPIWNANCVSCHSAADATLNLTSSVAGTGRYTSYESLMVGSPVLDTNGNPVLVVRDGVQVVETGPALVYSSASEGQVVGLARSSRLVEILSGQSLMSNVSSPGALAAFPTPLPPIVDHSTLLNASELRLVTEWIDLGGKYYNDPFNSSSGVQVVSGLSQATFTSQVYPILLSTCAANCHMARGSASTTLPGGASFVGDKFVLTGNPAGDYNNTLTMISDTCNTTVPSTNYLLSMPSSMPTSTPPHPANPASPTTAVLPVGSANYTTIANWIHSGCS